MPCEIMKDVVKGKDHIYYMIMHKKRLDRSSMFARLTFSSVGKHFSRQFKKNPVFPENRFRFFMQIVSIGDKLHEMSSLFSGKSHKVSKPVFWKKRDNLHEMSKPVFRKKNKKTSSICYLLN